MDRVFSEKVQIPSGSQISQIILRDFFLIKYYVCTFYSESLSICHKGFSINVEKRLQYLLNSEHKFTSKTKYWVIVYANEFKNTRAALVEEKRLKKLDRISIEKLIGQHFATSSRQQRTRRAQILSLQERNKSLQLFWEVFYCLLPNILVFFFLTLIFPIHFGIYSEIVLIISIIYFD